LRVARALDGARDLLHVTISAGVDRAVQRDAAVDRVDVHVRRRTPSVVSSASFTFVVIQASGIAASTRLERERCGTEQRTPPRARMREMRIESSWFSL
jgi:hypothetical protein